MNEVSSIGKFLEPLSEAYAHIPFEGWDCRDFEHRFTGILWNGDFKIEDYGKKEDSGQKSLCMVRDCFV